MRQKNFHSVLASAHTPRADNLTVGIHLFNGAATANFASVINDGVNPAAPMAVAPAPTPATTMTTPTTAVMTVPSVVSMTAVGAGITTTWKSTTMATAVMAASVGPWAGFCRYRRKSCRANGEGGKGNSDAFCED